MIIIIDVFFVVVYLCFDVVEDCFIFWSDDVVIVWVDIYEDVFVFVGGEGE